MDKRRMKAQQAAWNLAVDEYIDQGIDKRPRIDIERAAKIGPSHGALHLRCEHEECGKMQGRDVPTLRACSKCKIVCNRSFALHIERTTHSIHA